MKCFWPQHSACSFLLVHATDFFVFCSSELPGQLSSLLPLEMQPLMWSEVIGPIWVPLKSILQGSWCKGHTSNAALLSVGSLFTESLRNLMLHHMQALTEQVRSGETVADMVLFNSYVPKLRLTVCSKPSSSQPLAAPGSGHSLFGALELSVQAPSCSHSPFLLGKERLWVDATLHCHSEVPTLRFTPRSTDP